MLQKETLKLYNSHILPVGWKSDLLNFGLIVVKGVIDEPIEIVQIGSGAKAANLFEISLPGLPIKFGQAPVSLCLPGSKPGLHTKQVLFRKIRWVHTGKVRE